MDEVIKWIPVADQLPDDEITVLVFHPSMDEPVWLAYYEDHNWFSPDGYWLEGAVTHWAEIPAGPEVSDVN